MTTGNINYHAVLEDLEARKAELESAITAIKGIIAVGGVNGSHIGVISPENVPVGAFLRLSIADATKKFLDMVKTKQSVPQITKALEQGGLPPAKNNTVYSVLRRRENQFGDIIRVGDEWALSEWYPNNPNLRKRAESKSRKGKAKKTTSKKKPVAVKKKVAASTATPKAEPVVKTPDAVEIIIQKAGNALELKTINERLHTDFGKKIPVGLLKSLLLRDKKQRFTDVGDDIWIVGGVLGGEPEK